VRGCRDRAWLADSAHRHAVVLGLDHHGHTAWPQRLLQFVGNLRGESFLDLQTPGIDLDQACEFAEADNTIRRQIGDVGATGKRDHVVFAMRLHSDVAHDDRTVVVGGFVKGLSQHFARLLLVASEELAISAQHAVRRLAQAFAIGVFADVAEQGPNRRQCICAGHWRWFDLKERFVDVGRGAGHGVEDRRGSGAALLC
jgi:hypothetical protein